MHRAAGDRIGPRDCLPAAQTSCWALAGAWPGFTQPGEPLMQGRRCAVLCTRSRSLSTHTKQLSLWRRPSGRPASPPSRMSAARAVGAVGFRQRSTACRMAAVVQTPNTTALDGVEYEDGTEPGICQSAAGGTSAGSPPSSTPRSWLRGRRTWMEFGVHTGGTITRAANWRAQHCAGKGLVYGFDTFTGLPESWSNYEAVRRTVEHVGSSAIEGQIPLPQPCATRCEAPGDAAQYGRGPAPRVACALPRRQPRRGTKRASSLEFRLLGRVLLFFLAPLSDRLRIGCVGVSPLGSLRAVAGHPAALGRMLAGGLQPRTWRHTSPSRAAPAVARRGRTSGSDRRQRGCGAAGGSASD